MLKRALPFLLSVWLVACGGLAPSGGPAGSGGSLDSPAMPDAPASGPTAAQPVNGAGGEGSGETAFAYQAAPGFPAGNPGPDVTPEDKKFHFYIFPRLEEYEQKVFAGPVEASLKGIRVSGTLQCQNSEHATKPCQEGLVLRAVDLKKMNFVETKIEAAAGGRYAFQAEFPGSSQPEGPENFEYWLFYLNYSPDYAPSALDGIQACPGPGLGSPNFACLPRTRTPVWGLGYPLENVETKRGPREFTF